MIERVPHALLVSSVNGGGRFLISDGKFERLSRVDTSGIAVLPDGFLAARQAEGVAELVRLRGGVAQRMCLTPQSLDLHDVLWYSGRLYVVCTQLNSVLELDSETLKQRRVWELGGEADSQHVNSACVDRGRILVSRFGDFTQHRQYKGATKGAGQVIDIETGQVVISGLSQPHSLTPAADALWLCDSEAHCIRRYRDDQLVATVPLEGYARGLAVTESAVFVGLSASRNDAVSVRDHAEVVVLDPVSLRCMQRIALPVKEIYDIRIVAPDAVDALRLASMDDALQEYDTLQHQINVAGVARYEAELQSQREHHHVVRLQAEVIRLEQAVQRSEAAREQGLRDAHAQEVQLRCQLDEEAIWATHLRTFAHDQHAQLSALALENARANALLSDYQRFTEAVTATKIWRFGQHVGLLRVSPPQAPFQHAPEHAALPPPRRADVPLLELSFPETAEPRVSIIVTAYGEFQHTLACVRSISASLGDVAAEVIVIEDASGCEEMDRFATVPGLTYLRNDTNLGFLRSANKAAGVARGEYLHFLNNDTVVTPGWLRSLLATFGRFSDCGLVGSLLRYPDGRLQEVGAVVWSNGQGWNIGRGEDAAASGTGYAHRVDYVSGASLLIVRDVFERLGRFDEAFAPAYYEDTDLAFRVRQAGLHAYVEPSSVVVHHEGVSHGTDEAAGGKRHQALNRDTFVKRWRDVLTNQHLPPGAHPFLARDHAQSARTVLVVDRFAPQTDRDAGSRAVWQLMRTLHERGFHVKFWSMAATRGEEDANYVANLHAHAVEVVNAQSSQTLDEWLHGNGAYIDYTVLSRPLIAAEVLDVVRARTRSFVIYYGHDVHHLRLAGQAHVSGDAGLAAAARQLQEVEESLWTGCDLTLYPSSEEATQVNVYLARVGAASVGAAVPLLVEGDIAPVADGADAMRERTLVLFVGGFQHAPNEDGVLWFVRECWPTVAAACPEAHLVLVGSDPSDAVLSLGGNRITVAGAVTEAQLLADYSKARVAVAPLRFGAGVKGKVIEAMRLGVPCVATSVGAQGLTDASALRVCDDPDTFAAAVLALFDDDDAWQAASRSGQQFIRERFSAAALWDTLSEHMDRSPYATVGARLQRLAQSAHPSSLPSSSCSPTPT